MSEAIFEPGHLESEVESRLWGWREAGVGERLWLGDHRLWSTEPENA